MRAIEIRDKQLVVGQRDKPSPAAGQILIRVKAAGVNRPDILQRLGLYDPLKGESDIPGLEVAGIVEQVADGCTRFKVGDKVCALIAGGGYADYALATEAHCLPVPKGLSFDQAACLPECFATVWVNLVTHGRLTAGETLLVHGGSSGIGSTAIQIGKMLGAKVIVTAGSDEKCQWCKALGADLAVNYKQADFVEQIQQTYGKQPVHVVLDMVGGDYVAKNIKLLADQGRHVSIAFLRGAKVELNMFNIMRNRLVLTGSTLRPRSVAEKAEILQSLEQKVWPLIAAGKIKPYIDQSFPLEQAAQAHRLMESLAHKGKIVLSTGL